MTVLLILLALVVWGSMELLPHELGLFVCGVVVGIGATIFAVTFSYRHKEAERWRTTQ